MLTKRMKSGDEVVRKTTNKKRKTQKKYRPKKPKKTRTVRQKKFDAVKAAFLQKVGGVSLFIIILAALMGALLLRIVFNENSIFFNPFDTQQSPERQSFVSAIIPTAQKLQRQYGILASVSMAQAMVESDFGQSQLAADYHNLFGVKTTADDPMGVAFSTAEYFDDEWVEIVDYFKVYPDWDASMTAHAELIYYGVSWDENFYSDVIEGNTYVEQARGLQISGYATDPDYAQKLINMIEEWELTQYDQPL